VRLFGADGVRGLANADLTPELALRLGRALAGQLVKAVTNQPRVVVGRDPRPSSDMLEAAFLAGLCSGGVHAHRLGVVPTAAVAFLTRDLQANAGAVITASHNPLPDNGIKLFDHHGHKYTDAAETSLESLVGVADQGAARPRSLQVGRVRESAGLREAYLDHLVAGMPSLHGIPLVVDCANGAAAEIAPEAYRRAGATVRAIADDISGNAINAGAGATFPEHIAAARRGQEIGFAHDGDADRVIAVDEREAILDGADMLAVFALDRKRRELPASDGLVTSAMTNSGLRHSMATHGITVLEAPVGDRSVLQAMLRHGYRLGGEHYGHIILFDHATTGDGILTGLRLLAAVSAAERPLHEVAAVWQRAPQSLLNVPVSDRQALDRNPELPVLIRRERMALGDAGRLLVRMSTIEPVVRILCEATTEDRAAAVSARIADAVLAGLEKGRQAA
jgi:phosphoglucosamine mutase